MYSVALNNLIIFAKHGAYVEEEILQNKFTINLKVSYTDEHNFVDYAQLLRIVQKIFKQKENYLETIIKKIEIEIKKEFPFLKKISISIKKMHPPLSAEVESSEVILEREY